MAETWIDIRNGELLIGREAVADRIDEAGSDVVPLVELLEAEEFPFEVGNFGNEQLKGWTRDDLINFGHWIIKLLSEAQADDGSTLHLTSEHLKRLRILRLTPSRAVLRRHIGPIWRYREILGVEIGKADGRFDDWSTADYVAYAHGLATSLKRKPVRADYLAADGPGPHLFKGVGGVKGLNELIGYPNIHDMDEDDFIDWGVRAFEANQHLPFTISLIGALSKRKQGPSEQTIRENFTYFSEFYRRIQEKYNTLTKERVEAKALKLEEFLYLQKAGLLPEAASELSDDEKVKFIARYWVTMKCLPKSSQATHIRLALIKRPLVKVIREEYAYIAAGDIETTALRLQVFDDIWPMDEYKKHLHVSDEELEKIKKRRREHARKYFQQKRSAIQE